MNQVFTKLLEVRIWHDYFFLGATIPEQVPIQLDNSDLFEIVPSHRTEKVLRSLNLIFKTTRLGFQLIARIKEGDPNVTFASFDKRVKLTFFLRAKHPAFSIITGLPIGSFSKQLFYFQNLRTNTIDIGGNSVHFLSTPLPGFEQSSVYEMGDLIRVQERVFEVIDIPANQQPVPGLNRSDWAEGKNSQYVSRLDQVPYDTRLFSYEGKNTKPGKEVFFKVQNQFGEVIPLGLQNIPGEEIPVEKVTSPTDKNVNLRHTLFFGDTPEGLYTLSLEKDDLGVFYYIPGGEISKPLGVIELFHTPPTDAKDIPNVPQGFGFIDIGPDRKNPLSIPTGINYNLHFKSRLTYRRFISGDKVETLDRPLPLSLALQRVEIDNKKMPEPDVMSIDRVVDQVNNRTRERYFSNVFV